MRIVYANLKDYKELKCESLTLRMVVMVLIVSIISKKGNSKVVLISENVFHE